MAFRFLCLITKLGGLLNNLKCMQVNIHVTSNCWWSRMKVCIFSLYSAVFYFFLECVRERMNGLATSCLVM
jgi:hypothetical protein